MSSKLEPINKNLIISLERQLCSKINLDIDIINQNNTDIFNSLLKNFSQANIDHLYFMNKLLPSVSNFNDICLKYFLSLIDSFKFHMNQKKTNKNTNYELNLVLNSLSNFIKIFSANQEKYNEKHKSVLKQFPIFLQLFFKLFQQRLDDLITNYDKEKKIIESFFILCLTFIEYYPTLMRNYQNIIEKFIKNIFYSYIVQNNIDKNSVNIAIVLYVNLYKLSPNMVNRHQDYIINIINNIKYYMEFFKPKTIDEEDNNKNNNNSFNLEERNNVFFIDNNKKEKKEDIDNKNIVHADKTMEILFKLLNNIFKYMASNIYFEINFNNIFSLFNDILNIYESLDSNKSKSSLSMIVFNGLTKTNYELFLINTNEKIIDILIFLISNFSRYIYCYNIFFSKYINKILLNQKFYKYSIYTFNLHIKILSFFSTIISYFNHILPEEIELIIYKHVYNNLPVLYLKYLQQNDKSMLKVDEVYFKASSIKNKIYSYDNDNINDNLSPNDNHILLMSYFKILYNYCSVTKKISLLNYRNILGGLIDLVILPPFAKFIFNIDYDIKKIIIDIIEISIKRNLIYINKQKCYNFLNNFYFYDGDLKYHAEIVLNLFQIKDSELLKGDSYDENNNYYGGVPNNVCEQIFDFNKKIKEFLNDTYKKLEQMKSSNNDIKNDNKNQINDINNEINNINDNEILNKKRKKEKEEESENENESKSEEDKKEKKGNKKKNNKNKKKERKYIHGEKQKIEDIKFTEENNNNNDNEKEDKLNKIENEIQIDEDIDIPDIV